MNVDELGLPAGRELPDAVRQRLRVELDREMARETTGQRRVFKPFAVAAAVMVLFAGAIFVAQGLPGDRGLSVGGALPLDPVKANAELDRCWAGAQAQGAKMPERSNWVPSFNVGRDGLSVVAARADGKPFFCETTATTVTVTDPNVPPVSLGNGVGSVLFSANGVIAGVVDLPWESISLTRTRAGYESSTVSPISDHLFVAILRTPVVGTSFVAGDGQKLVRGTVPEPGPPAVSFVDRPAWPAPDRASEAGRFLGTCLTGSAEVVLNRESYEPGAMVATTAGNLVVGRSPDSLVLCLSESPGGYLGSSLKRDATPPLAVYFAGATGEGGAEFAAGSVPVTATRMTVGDAAKWQIEATVSRGTFVVLFPPTTDFVGRRGEMVVKLYDSEDRLLEEGPLPMRK
jgi:hypothetical protein